MTSVSTPDPLKAALLGMAARHRNPAAVAAASAALRRVDAVPTQRSLTFAEQRLKARLLAAAMLRCDELGDGEAAREEMRRQCLEVPVGQWKELLEYFGEVADDGRQQLQGCIA